MNTELEPWETFKAYDTFVEMKKGLAKIDYKGYLIGVFDLNGNRDDDEKFSNFEDYIFRFRTAFKGKIKIGRVII